MRNCCWMVHSFALWYSSFSARARHCIQQISRPCQSRAIPRPSSAMLRRATTALLRQPGLACSRAWGRFLSTDPPAAPCADSAFVEAWKKVVPNIEPPKTPLSFMQPRPPNPSSIPTKLTVNFVLPYASELSQKEVSDYTHMLPQCESHLFCDSSPGCSRVAIVVVFEWIVPSAWRLCSIAGTHTAVDRSVPSFPMLHFIWVGHRWWF